MAPATGPRADDVRGCGCAKLGRKMLGWIGFVWILGGSAGTGYS
jgi:hypothetical protein